MTHTEAEVGMPTARPARWWPAVVGWLVATPVLVLVTGDIKLVTLALAVGVYWLARGAVRSRRWAARFGVFAAAYVALSIAAPVAVYVRSEGHYGLRAGRVVYGEPSPGGRELMRRRGLVWGGCCMFAPFPSRWAVVIELP